MKGEIKNGQFVWIHGEVDGMQYFQWDTPGVITHVSDTHFSVMKFDGFEVTEYEKNDYSKLEKNGWDRYIGGNQNHYKNSIKFIDKKLVDEYAQQSDLLNEKKKKALAQQLDNINEQITALNKQKSFTERIKEYIPAEKVV